jgi:hypothetical protein
MIKLIFLVLMSGSAAHAGGETAIDNVKYPVLRDQLLMRVADDQNARRSAMNWAAEHGDDGLIDEDSLSEEQESAYADLWAEIAKIDANNTKWLKAIVSERGWPTYSEVGIDGGDAAWLLVQHADADPGFQRQCLDLMTALPKHEISQLSVAYLTDRVLLKEGKNQIYGTQFIVQEGELVPNRLEDEENVDARRAEVGLPPMAEYKATLEAVMRGDVEIE